MPNQVTPYQDTKNGKKVQVAEMFDTISERYDFLNHFLSLGIDRIWRKRAIDQLKGLKPKNLLDLATGTGDLAIMASKRLGGIPVTGIDISEGMLSIGKQKIIAKKLSENITLKYGDSENILEEDNTYDATMVAFGVRNFENLLQGLKEMHRVTKPGGKTVILEFSKPAKFPIKQLFWFYFKAILPVIGKTLSKDHRAYTYLPESVEVFPEGIDFLQVLEKAGFKNTHQIRLSGGISTIYAGDK